jgi:hypothetical protein
MTTARQVDRDALMVAMAVVPGLYSRNRMFAMYGDPEVKRAKARASVIRGVVRQLTGFHGEPGDIALARNGDARTLRYRIPRVKLDRRLELSEIEAACLVYLAGRAGVRGMHPSAEDRAHIDSALRRLAGDLRLSKIEADALHSSEPDSSEPDESAMEDRRAFQSEPPAG